MNLAQIGTTTTLLEQLAQPANKSVWEEFDAHYRPILLRFACRLGLNGEDAADAAQETLIRFLGAYRDGKYDRQRGRLSAWILGIARHCVIEQQRRRARRREARGVSAIVGLPGRDHLALIWEAECTRAVFRRALRTLREETRTDGQTIRAFELLTFHGVGPAQVAAELDMTMNDVYLAKHRCLKRLRSIVAGLDARYEAGK